MSRFFISVLCVFALCAVGLGFVLVAAFGIAVPSLYDDIGLLYGFTAVLLARAVGLQLCFLRQFKAPVQGKSVLKDVLQADSRPAILRINLDA